MELVGNMAQEGGGAVRAPAEGSGGRESNRGSESGRPDFRVHGVFVTLKCRSQTTQRGQFKMVHFPPMGPSRGAFWRNHEAEGSVSREGAGLV